MSKSRVKVAFLAAEREAQEAKKAFLELVHADITEHPERIEPIPASLLNRMAHLRARAQVNRERDELLEG
ncbi:MULTISPECIES: hypothetical protein [Pseudomonas]|uniref:Uncharacterized protein n=2 Tax=Pseudomonas TaxID=286 RepID=A0AA42URA7_9PSED|nr:MULTISPECIES: hypothetical protein [Pseudomonas]MBI6897901.1 hypothetical protein [Pseudomonas putida]MBV4504046.1 hypothetical protein [Pseudomonas peradeniyensis]MDH1632291.1 hypothetical protein [Pseudomonas mosselii]ODB34890.1 hypothetical protein A9L43_26090 [Pseudomonas mosselii]